jgi:hypothetical protein
MRAPQTVTLGVHGLPQRPNPYRSRSQFGTDPQASSTPHNLQSESGDNRHRSPLDLLDPASSIESAV